MEIARPTDEQVAIHALTSVKVSMGSNDVTFSGYLTDTSAKMLLLELERHGFKMNRS